MSNKLNYQLLTAQIKVETIKDLFVNETRFLQDQIWLFTEQQPQILMSWNNGSLMLSEVQQIRAMMEHVQRMQEQEKQQNISGASLISASHRQGY